MSSLSKIIIALVCIDIAIVVFWIVVERDARRLRRQDRANRAKLAEWDQQRENAWLS